jgi:uncharacterized membrane protein
MNKHRLIAPSSGCDAITVSISATVSFESRNWSRWSRLDLLGISLSPFYDDLLQLHQFLQHHLHSGEPISLVFGPDVSRTRRKRPFGFLMFFDPVKESVSVLVSVVHGSLLLDLGKGIPIRRSRKLP